MEELILATIIWTFSYKVDSLSLQLAYITSPYSNAGLIKYTYIFINVSRQSVCLNKRSIFRRLQAFSYIHVPWVCCFHLASDWKFKPRWTWLFKSNTLRTLFPNLIIGWAVFFQEKFKLIVFLGLKTTIHWLHLSNLSRSLVVAASTISLSTMT